MMGTLADYKIILFDLGGVLLRLRDPISTFGLDIDESEFLHTWILSPSVRALESGRISCEEFAKRIVDELALPMDWPELLERFDNWPGGIYPRAIDLIHRIPSRYTCAILSNTNAVHWQRVDVSGHFGDRFDRLFLSYESGLLKPDQESFLQVITSYGCLPREILFFDDNPVNVSAARNEGITAIRIEGPGQLELALTEAGII
jgi:putative hydrolase of the HAD superfamily